MLRCNTLISLLIPLSTSCSLIIEKSTLERNSFSMHFTLLPPQYKKGDKKNLLNGTKFQEILMQKKTTKAICYYLMLKFYSSLS